MDKFIQVIPIREGSSFEKHVGSDNNGVKKANKDQVLKCRKEETNAILEFALAYDLVSSITYSSKKEYYFATFKIRQIATKLTFLQEVLINSRAKIVMLNQGRC